MVITLSRLSVNWVWLPTLTLLGQLDRGKLNIPCPLSRLRFWSSVSPLIFSLRPSFMGNQNQIGPLRIDHSDRTNSHTSVDRRQYYMGFRIVSLQIKIGGYERPIWRISFSPVLWGSKSLIWTTSISIFISTPVFAQNLGSILSDFPVAHNCDCIVCQAFMSDYMKQIEGGL